MQGCCRNCKGCRVGKRSPQAPPEEKHWSVWRQIQSSHFSHLASQWLLAVLVGVLPATPSRNVAGREQHLIKQRRREKNQEQMSKEGVFHLDNGYPVKTDTFMSSSFYGRGCWGGWAEAQLGWVEKLQPDRASHGVGIPPGKKPTEAEQTASGPLLREEHCGAFPPLQADSRWTTVCSMKSCRCETVIV